MPDIHIVFPLLFPRAGASVIKSLLDNPWYKEHIRAAHDGHQEVMLGE